MAIPPKHFPPVEGAAVPPPVPPAAPAKPKSSLPLHPGLTNAAQVALPLSADLRAAYQHLYDLYESAIQATSDAATLLLLNDAQSDLDDILTKDNLYALNQDTTLFGVLQTQIQSTNDGLDELQKKIALVASHIALAGQILAAINKVISLVPGL